MVGWFDLVAPVVCQQQQQFISGFPVFLARVKVSPGDGEYYDAERGPSRELGPTRLLLSLIISPGSVNSPVAGFFLLGPSIPFPLVSVISTMFRVVDWGSFSGAGESE